MVIIVGIQFQKNGKIYNYDVNNLDLHQDDFVIVDTPHGIDLGQVAVGCRQVEENDSELQLKKVIRIANEKDLQMSAENRRKEREAYEICQKKIAEHKLDMKLVSVEYAFDNSKALFYFTANGRVDFRSLVKDLASVFKMRIELRQIGVRDEARMLGGLGPCGRPICCGTFLDEFQPVSIKMAKEQNLSLNPTKISGVCGRLMCCLKYEQDHYEQTRKIMPKLGKEVITPDGTGTVSDLNIVKETVFVRITNGDSSEIKEYPLDKIQKVFQNAPIQKCEILPSAEESENSETITPPDGSERRNSDGTAEKAQSRPQRHSKPGQSSAASKGKDHRKAEKKDGSKHNSALGKPVMRENPNKTAQIKNSTAFSESDRGNSSSWAEAVRKAIDSMN